VEVASKASAADKMLSGKKGITDLFGMAFAFWSILTIFGVGGLALFCFSQNLGFFSSLGLFFFGSSILVLIASGVVVICGIHAVKLELMGREDLIN